MDLKRSTFCLVHILLHLLTAVSAAIIFQNPDDLNPNTEYDFIVVGGGNAGAVVATRLGEDKNFNILVIEAGPSNEDIFATHPPALFLTLAHTTVDWNYTTVPQRGTNGRTADFARAKMLGGCTSHNSMIYTRGSRDDYDRWAQVTGDRNLSWDNMLPNILKTEKWTLDNEHQDEQGHVNLSVHGRHGKVAVSAPYTIHPFNDQILQASKELSSEFPFKLDMNDGKPIGISWNQFTVNKGVRSSSATGYLATTGKNVHVLLNTFVTRVLPVNENSSEADFRKVEFSASAQSPKKVLVAAKEVIISGGVINTPHLLLNSGIGDRDQLDALGIPTLVDNPSVGKNFSDQVSTPILFSTNLTNTDFNRTGALEEWNKTHTGPLSLPWPLNHLVWLRLNSTSNFSDPTAGENSPHIEIFIGGISSQQPMPIVDLPPGANVTVQTLVVNLHPVSRGSIVLNSSNPFDYPKIDVNMLDDETDIAILREGIRGIRRLFSAPVWENKIFGTVLPPSNTTTDQELDDYIRSVAGPFLHGVGSAAMSPPEANWGVVNPDFRVKGTVGLRVVDASVLPYVSSGHTQAPVYAISERASDVLRKAWSKSN